MNARSRFAWSMVFAALFLMGAACTGVQEGTRKESPTVAPGDVTETFIRAVKENDIGGVKRCLAQGANPSAEDRRQKPVLFIASYRGYTDVVKALLAAGADVNMAGEFYKDSALINAVAGGRLETARALIEAGADVNHQQTGSISPLIQAVMENNADMVKLLLENKADPNSSTRDGVAAIIQAAGQNNLEIVKLLVQYGADVNARSMKGYSAMRSAMANGNEEMVKVLKDAGAKRPTRRELMLR